LDLRARRWWEAAEHCITRSFITCLLHQILLGFEVRENELGRACNTRERTRSALISFVEKAEGNRPLLRPSRRCEDNIGTDHSEKGGRDWRGFINGGEIPDQLNVY